MIKHNRALQNSNKELAIRMRIHTRHTSHKHNLMYLSQLMTELHLDGQRGAVERRDGTGVMSTFMTRQMADL